MSGKSHLTFCRLSQSDIRERSVPEGIGNERNLEFSIVGNDRRPSQKSGTRRESVSRIRFFFFRTIGDIYDFEFSLVGKIRDGWETVKSQHVDIVICTTSPKTC